ncbi:protein kinase 2A, chloroplastic-like [Canna indica]|uniref:Protein kinase 2A, chloroplastic-like n=1 Tax=Canna indica TaxID=4628 RepID=A0AAQ3QGF4_9LILI|nr:protein kinase 2A, chloroplastic-like [Canna indica]
MEVANIAQLAGLDPVRLIGLIVRAASTARSHKKNCKEFSKYLQMIGGLLEPLNISELKSYPETSAPLMQLEDTLRRAYLLVRSCQDRSFPYLLAMGWNSVLQFRRAREEIDDYLKLIPLITLLDIVRSKEKVNSADENRNKIALEEGEIQTITEENRTENALENHGYACSYENNSSSGEIVQRETKIRISIEENQNEDTLDQGSIGWSTMKRSSKTKAASDRLLTTLNRIVELGINDAFLRIFTAKELNRATNNFDPENFMGEGGMGVVYKGWVKNNSINPANEGSRIQVAVKKWKTQNLLWAWQAEVNVLGRMSHPNLIKLLGFCMEDEELLLVYPFMPNGSLDDHLHGRCKNPLSWDQRIKIATGAARGLAFLHMSEKPIIHRLVNPGAILLDSNLNAKLTGFGFSTHVPNDDEPTMVCGTIRYIAPEYISHNKLSLAADVYSFGVVLLQMLTGDIEVRYYWAEEPFLKLNLSDPQDLGVHPWRRFWRSLRRLS